VIELDNRQKAEFWHRSYAAVDGLWFMKVEEKYGFDASLDVDNEVWKILPKIQARTLRALGEIKDGIGGLFECLTTKLHLEGFAFKAERDGDGAGFKIIISRCPWHDLMVKSQREELSGKVGSLICNTEYSVWAGEFGDGISFKLEDRICEGSESCVLCFASATNHTPGEG